jgi:hypothetical protein
MWTLYKLNFTATSSYHVLIFGFQNENNRGYLLDDASVIDTGVPGFELLTNYDFENSSVSPTGWTQSCTSTCSGFSGSVITFGNCFSGNCFEDKCRASSGIDFLEQTFLTIIGHTYSVSFRLLLDGSGTTTANAFFVDIF